MNTIHDMGGMHGFGPLEVEPDEPPFHHDWERRVFAMTTAVTFAVPFNDDQLRPAIESIPPDRYLVSSYYELWLEALTKVLIRRRVITEDELATSRADAVPHDVEVFPAAKPANAVGALLEGFPARRDDGKPARFKVGDAVRARVINPPSHTRLPRYARGKKGKIIADHGIMSFNDANGRGDGEQPQHVYTVAFDMRELWGQEAPAPDRLHLDLWDDHLDPA